MNFFKKISEKLKTKKYKNTPDPRTSFNSIIKATEVNLDGKSESEKLIILDYIIDILKVDICSSGIVEPFIIQPSGPHNMPFPNTIYDENGNAIDGHCGEMEVNLEQVDIFVRPWNVERQFNNVIFLKNIDFKYDKINHFSYYYKDINLCYVFNGNHSINAGRYLKKGKITSICCDITVLYPHCHTDGVYWYNSHKNDIIADVEDFRLAAIYELAKKRHSFKHNKPTEA